jgi:hypothetical protein
MLPTQREHVQSILQIAVLRMKYHAGSYDFNEPSDEEEAFQLYRDTLKTFICNIAQLVRSWTVCKMRMWE